MQLNKTTCLNPFQLSLGFRICWLLWAKNRSASFIEFSKKKDNVDLSSIIESIWSTFWQFTHRITYLTLICHFSIPHNSRTSYKPKMTEKKIRVDNIHFFPAFLESFAARISICRSICSVCESSNLCVTCFSWQQWLCQIYLWAVKGNGRERGRYDGETYQKFQICPLQQKKQKEKKKWHKNVCTMHPNRVTEAYTQKDVHY